MITQLRKGYGVMYRVTDNGKNLKCWLVDKRGVAIGWEFDIQITKKNYVVPCDQLAIGQGMRELDNYFNSLSK